MPSLELPLHPDASAFDPARVRFLERGSHTLVMDRVSGRWLTVQASAAPLLPLLATPPDRLPDTVRSPVADLRALLREHRIGTPGSERRFGDLNTLILKLTNACNLACAYCYDFETSEHATTLDPEVGRRALAEALDLAPEQLWVILHGGEPMLLWDTVEALVVAGERFAAERGKRIRFVGQTNLTRLDDRIVAFSLEHDIAWGVSVDGTAGIHDHFRVTRRGTGSYAAFERMLDRYPRFVRGCGVMSTITALNQGRLLEIARHFRDLGMPSWDWSLFQPIGRGREAAHRFVLDAERLVASWDELFAAVEAGEFDGFPVLPVKKYLDNFVAGPGGNMCMRGECGAGRDLLSISADGTIEACDCIDPTGPLAGLGQMAGDTLAAARDSPVAQRIRARDLRDAPCADCIWYGVCGGTCLAHAPSLNEVWSEGCAVAMRAFDRISASLVESDDVVRYLRSLP
jgi:uncharacterized protein